MASISKKKILLSIVVGLIVALVATIGFLHTRAARLYVFESVREYLRDNHGVVLEADSLDYNLFRASARLDQVQVYPVEVPRTPPFFQADTVSVNVGLLASLWHGITIEEAKLEGVDLQIVVTPDGKLNLPRATESSETETGTGIPDFLIQSLRADGPRLAYEDRQQNIRLVLPQWSLEVEGESLGSDHVLRFQTAQTGSAGFEERSAALDRVNLAASFSPQAVKIDRFQVVSQESTLELTGTVEDLDNPTFDLALKADVEAERAGELAAVSFPLKGRVHANVTLQNGLDNLMVRAQLDAPSLTAGEFRDLEIRTASSWDRAAEQVVVDSLSLESPDGRAQLQARIALGADATSQADAEFERLNLQRLTRQFDLPVRLASRLSGAASARWPGLQIEEAAGQANLRIAQSQQNPSKGLIPVSGSVSVTAEGRSVQLSIQSLEALGAEVEGELSVIDREQLQGQLEGKSANLQQMITGFDTVLGNTAEDSIAPTEVVGPATLSATIGGTVDRPQVSSTFAADSLQIGDVQAVSARVDADYNPDRLLVREARVDWRGQSLQAHGTIGLQGRDATLDLRARTEETSLSSILRLLDSDIPVEGTLSVLASVTGTTEKPNADLAISGRGLQAYGEPLGTLQAKAQLDDQTLDFTEFRLDKSSEDGSGGFLELSGRYDLDQKAYSVKADGSQLQFRSLALPGDIPLRGDLNLAVEGDGTIDDPRLDVRLNINHLVVDEREIGGLDLTAQLAGQQASLQANAPKFNLQAEAQGRTQAPYPVEFQLSANKTDLSAFEMNLAENEPLTGSVTAQIRGTGEAKHWQNATVTARVDDLLLAVKGREIRNQGPLELAYEGRALSADSTLALGDSRLGVQGSLPLKEGAPPGTLQVQGDLNLDTLASLIPTQQPTVAQGRMEIDASLRGSLQSLEPTLDLSVRRAGIYNRSIFMPLTGVQAEARYEAGSLRLTELQAEWAGAKITGSGTLPLGLFPVKDLPIKSAPAQGPAALQLSVQGLIIDSISDLPPELGGTVSLTANLEAPNLQADAVTGRVRFDELRFNYESFEISQEGTAAIALEKDRLQIDSFVLSGPSTRLQVGGGMTFGENSAIDLQIGGRTDVGVLALAADAVEAQGVAQFQIAVNGTLEQPQLTGDLNLENTQVNIDEPGIQLAGLNVDLNLDPERVSIQQFTGDLNGGSFQAGGGFTYSGLEVGDVDVNLGAKGVFLGYPEGLDTLLDTDLRIQSNEDLIVVGGEVEIIEASYTKPIEINQFLFDYLRSGDTADFVEEPDPFLSRIRYDTKISNSGPIIIDNNLAELSANADLRLSGTYYRPGLTGRLTLEEGGELYLAENRYIIDRGVVDFASENRIQPVTDIVARTQVRRKYDIELQITGGGPEPISTTLTSSSHPELSEPDLISLLLTGREREQLRGEEINVAAEQSLSLITGQIGGRISSGAQRALGLSEVRIEPSLIAAESDPGARLTVGESITDDFSLIYSMNLADSSDQIWIAQYDITKRFTTEAIKQEDNSYRTEFRHDVQFGGSRDSGKIKARRPRKEIAHVDFRNRFGLSEQELAEKLKIQPGKTYDFFRVRRRSDKLERALAKEGFLEADVKVRREQRQPDAEQVELVVEGDLGPRIRLAFEGARVPEDVREEVETVWREGIFDLQRIERAVEVLRRHFVNDGYIESEVQHTISTVSEDEKQVVFDIKPGARYKDVALRFEGATAFTDKELADRLEGADLQTAVHVESQRVTDLLERTYQQKGYLDAKIERPRYELDSQKGTGEVVISIQEGPQYKVSEVNFQGNEALSDSDLRGVLPFAVDQSYQPEFLRVALNRLEERYWREGYNDVVISFNAARKTNQGTVGISFDIAEHQRGMIQEVKIAGNEATSDNLVQTQLTVEKGQPLNFEEVSRSRKNLYDTGAYALVDIETQPVESEEALVGQGQKPLELQVRLREVKPYQLRYGAFFDTERGPGVIADFTNRNILGSARVVGLRTRYDADDKEARVYFSQPLLRRFPLQSTAVAFVRRQDRAAFVTDTAGFSLLQEARFGESLILNYGYRYEENHTFEREPDPFFPFDERVTLAPLTATLSRETRDDILDATRGSFTSHSVKYASTKLGSGLAFVKYFGQYFKYIPLSSPAREMPYGGPVERPRLVYAGGVRLGLGRGLGGLDLFVSEKFFAGGGTSIRGFEQDALGPTFLDDPQGGNAVFIVNNELRFPLISIFDGVTFVDIGNVYEKASNFDLFDVRKTAGVGLRVRTPYFLLRADYGFKLDRKPGESLGSFFFSIGQAF